MSLPSGIGLYKSVFKDIHGSVYCYGGPHKIFTDINKRFIGKPSHITAYLAEHLNQYQSSPYSLPLRFERFDKSEMSISESSIDEKVSDNNVNQMITILKPT